MGRLPECAVVLGDPNVSRRHAEIRHVGDAVVVTDLGSTNGTKVNGIPVREQHLASGDEITVGSTTLVFECRDPERPARCSSAPTNYSALLRPLQWLVIVLVFLFFLRVVRAVWVEVRPAGPRRPAGAGAGGREEARPRRRGHRGRKKKKQLFLEVLEPAGPGWARRSTSRTSSPSAGHRGAACPTTYDVYSSTLHARLYRRGEQLWVEDLGSTNGTYVNSERITKATRLARGDLLQVGATVFEVTR